MQEDIKAMTEIFDDWSVTEDPISGVERVVKSLSSLPDLHNVLVTALEAKEEVSKIEVVTEQLLHEERRLKE